MKCWHISSLSDAEVQYLDKQKIQDLVGGSILSCLNKKAGIVIYTLLPCGHSMSAFLILYYTANNIGKTAPRSHNSASSAQHMQSRPAFPVLFCLKGLSQDPCRRSAQCLMSSLYVCCRTSGLDLRLHIYIFAAA